MRSAVDLPIFVVSPRYARELEDALVAASLDVTVSNRAPDAGTMFADGTAQFAIVDARGSLVAGLSASRDLADTIEARRGVLLVLLSRNDSDALGAVYATGATHVLVSPFGTRTLLDKILICARMVDRLGAAAAGHALVSAPKPPRRDPLTGLSSAGYAMDWVELLLGEPVIADPAVIVLTVAFGRLDQINAAYGRTVADALLQSVAARLRLAAAAQSEFADGGETRMVSRLAGAEFGIVLAGPVTLAAAVQFAQRVVDAFERPFAVGGRLIHLACRIGLANADEELRNSGPGRTETLFRRASAALTIARTREPGSIEVFQPDPAGDSMTRMADLEVDLRRALDSDDLEILFQPQVELSSRLIIGAEALVRWRHPVLGELSPDTIFEVAENAELGAQLGMRLRALAVRTALSWPGALADLRVSINVTAADLRTPGFGPGLLAMLGETGFPPSRLTIEVTEGGLIESLDEAAELLAMLRQSGVEVALDDFGTGYSSLAYLKSLPLDVLKVDKRLVADLGGSARDRIVVKGVVDMARALGICVCAEGVETEAQHDAVRAAGCDWYQGYLCAPPLPSADFAAHVQCWTPREVA